jgi:hypothetical protein
MGLLYKLFMPRGIKRIRRKVTRVAHPVRTARRAVTPRAVKAAVHPVSYTKGAVENSIVRSVKGGKSRSRTTTRTGPVVQCQHCGTKARGVMCPSCRRRMLPRTK